MPNGRLVQYTKPLLEFQCHPNQRYKRICGRIPDADSDQLLSTLGGAIERFRNDAVALFNDGMEDAMESGKTDDVGGTRYLYLGDLWFPTGKIIWWALKRNIWASAAVGNHGPNPSGSGQIRYNLRWVGRGDPYLIGRG